MGRDFSWYDQTRNLQSGKKEILAQIRELEGKLAYLRDLLVSQKLDPDDYRVMKAEYIKDIERLEAKISHCTDTPMNIDKLLGQGVNTLFRIDRLYEEGSPEKKNVIIGSMFAEKLTSDGFLLRTARVNEVARLIYRLDAGFSGNKKGQKSDFSLLSCEVTPSGFKLCLGSRCQLGF